MIIMAFADILEYLLMILHSIPLKTIKKTDDNRKRKSSLFLRM
jgi:hypothetical protein